MKPHQINWDLWDAELGSVPDEVLACRIGCGKLAVLKRRQRLGIAAFLTRKLAARAGLAAPIAAYHFAEDGSCPEGIYLLTNDATGEQYVGQSKSLRERLAGHARTITLGKHPHPAIRDAVARHGAAAFRLEILELVTTASLDAREEYWIATLSPAYNRIAVIGPRRKAARKKRRSS